MGCSLPSCNDPSTSSYAFPLTYLLFPARVGDEDNRLHWYNWALAIFAGYIGLYMALNYMRIMEAGGDYSRMDYIAAGFGILLTLEAGRRVVGLPIVCLATFFLLFCYFGAYFPGFMSHRGYSLERIASHMFLTTEGIFGIPFGVAATFIYLFILFGSFREKSGLGQLFIDISNAVAGWAPAARPRWRSSPAPWRARCPAARWPTLWNPEA